MFKELFTKINSFADHHQVIIGIIIGMSIICCTWGFENLLQHFLFPKKPLYGYIIAALGGLLMLWLTKHYILHAI